MHKYMLLCKRAHISSESIPGHLPLFIRKIFLTSLVSLSSSSSWLLLCPSSVPQCDAPLRGSALALLPLPVAAQTLETACPIELNYIYLPGLCGGNHRGLGLLLSKFTADIEQCRDGILPLECHTLGLLSDSTGRLPCQSLPNSFSQPRQ